MITGQLELPDLPRFKATSTRLSIVDVWRRGLFPELVPSGVRIPSDDQGVFHPHISIDYPPPGLVLITSIEPEGGEIRWVPNGAGGVDHGGYYHRYEFWDGNNYMEAFGPKTFQRRGDSPPVSFVERVRAGYYITAANPRAWSSRTMRDTMCVRPTDDPAIELVNRLVSGVISPELLEAKRQRDMEYAYQVEPLFYRIPPVELLASDERFGVLLAKIRHTYTNYNLALDRKGLCEEAYLFVKKKFNDVIIERYFS